MKAQLLMLSAAGLLLAASASHAAPAYPDRYAQWAQTKADALLRARHVDMTATSASVRATVSPDGKRTGTHVSRSSGSAETDAAVTSILRSIVFSRPPLGLVNGAVTLNVRGGDLETAAR